MTERHRPPISACLSDTAGNALDSDRHRVIPLSDRGDRQDAALKTVCSKCIRLIGMRTQLSNSADSPVRGLTSQAIGRICVVLIGESQLHFSLFARRRAKPHQKNSAPNSPVKKFELWGQIVARCVGSRPLTRVSRHVRHLKVTRSTRDVCDSEGCTWITGIGTTAARRVSPSQTLEHDR